MRLLAEFGSSRMPDVARAIELPHEPPRRQGLVQHARPVVAGHGADAPGSHRRHRRVPVWTNLEDLDDERVLGRRALDEERPHFARPRSSRALVVVAGLREGARVHDLSRLDAQDRRPHGECRHARGRLEADSLRRRGCGRWRLSDRRRGRWQERHRAAHGHESHDAPCLGPRTPVLLGGELEGDAVHAVPKAGRARAVLEDMSEMAPASAAMHFGAGHEMAAVNSGRDRPVLRLEEARPPGPALILRGRVEELLAAAGAS